MNKSRFLALSLLLAASGVGSAYAETPALTTGTYKLTVGSKAACDVAVTAEGAFAPSADCSVGMTLAKWRPSGAGFTLLSAAGETYAVLKPHGDSYEGTTFADQHKVVLSH
jgi:hypothetical protein